MNIVKNKKGFTLIELLAVIVILAIIILIAATNIGGLTQTAKKNVLAVEGNTLVDSAKLAYQQAQLDGEITGVGDYCFSVEYLKKNGFFDKGKDEKYFGSVLVTPNSDGKVFTYKFWISNGSLKIDADSSKNGTVGSGAPAGVKGKSAVSTEEHASENCNGLGTAPKEENNTP